MKRYKHIIILINLLGLLTLVAHSVVEKESLLSEGQLILLELAPVDPRSLMQGDYMQLQYAISQDVPQDIPKRGFCVVTLDTNGVARRVRLQENRSPLESGEYLIPYTSREWRGINIGAESFFFQEGEAEKFEVAEYGGIKVDARGNSLLVGLYDKNLKKIE